METYYDMIDNDPLAYIREDETGLTIIRFADENAYLRAEKRWPIEAHYIDVIAQQDERGQIWRRLGASYGACIRGIDWICSDGPWSDTHPLIDDRIQRCRLHIHGIDVYGYAPYPSIDGCMDSLRAACAAIGICEELQFFPAFKLDNDDVERELSVSAIHYKVSVTDYGGDDKIIQKKITYLRIVDRTGETVYVFDDESSDLK